MTFLLAICDEYSIAAVVVVYKYDIHTECLVGKIIMLDAGCTQNGRRQ